MAKGGLFSRPSVIVPKGVAVVVLHPAQHNHTVPTEPSLSLAHAKPAFHAPGATRLSREACVPRSRSVIGYLEELMDFITAVRSISEQIQLVSYLRSNACVGVGGKRLIQW
jgi:hypothetical protein